MARRTALYASHSVTGDETDLALNLKYSTEALWMSLRIALKDKRVIYHPGGVWRFAKHVVANRQDRVMVRPWGSKDRD